jgi:hypothetical protein
VSRWICGLLMVFLVSCGEEEVKTVRRPKVAGVVLDAELPAGWREVEPSGMRKAVWSIEGTEIDFYLIVLAMGDVSSNVNRWRGQVGLAPESPEQIASSVERFEVQGRLMSYVKLYNPENGMGIIAAIWDRAPEYWYYTAKGSVDELRAHEGEIRAFLVGAALE